MGHSIEQYEFLEKVRKIILLNRFDVNAVIEDTKKLLGREVDDKYIKGIIGRLKRRGNREAIEKAGGGIATYLFEGHESRMIQYHDTLRVIRGKEISIVSFCCGMPIKKDGLPGSEQLYCLKCKSKTEALEVVNEAVIDIKRNLLKDIRDDVKETIQAYLSIRDGKTYRGLSDFEPPKTSDEQPIKYKQVELTQESQQIVEVMKAMLPHQREVVLNMIQAKLVDEKLDAMGFPKTEEDGKE